MICGELCSRRMRLAFRVNVAIFIVAALFLLRGQLNTIYSQWHGSGDLEIPLDSINREDQAAGQDVANDMTEVASGAGDSDWLESDGEEAERLGNNAQGDKVIVMGKLQHEDTDWVAKHLAELVTQGFGHCELETNECPQLAARNLYCRQYLCTSSHLNQQRPRSPTVPHLHHRQLRCSTLYASLHPQPSERPLGSLPSFESVAHRCGWPRQCAVFENAQSRFCAAQRVRESAVPDISGLLGEDQAVSRLPEREQRSGCAHISRVARYVCG